MTRGTRLDATKACRYAGAALIASSVDRLVGDSSHCCKFCRSSGQRARGKGDAPFVALRTRLRGAFPCWRQGGSVAVGDGGGEGGPAVAPSLRIEAMRAIGPERRFVAEPRIALGREG
ncbi:MAG TPA: hypothetical protein DEP35_08645 [Deltaproteobacteria bacterium]|nr:hypothetical protein [Deltaproteobacteria bacterium]